MADDSPTFAPPYPEALHIPRKFATTAWEDIPLGLRRHREKFAAAKGIEPNVSGGAGVEVEAETTTSVSTTTEPPAEPSNDEPFEGYDGLTVDEVADELDALSQDQLEGLRDYEAAHANRVTLLAKIDAAIEAGDGDE